MYYFNDSIVFGLQRRALTAVTVKRAFHFLRREKIQFGTEGIGILQFTRTRWLNGLMYRYLRRPKLSLSAGAAASKGN